MISLDNNSNTEQVNGVLDIQNPILVQDNSNENENPSYNKTDLKESGVGFQEMVEKKRERNNAWINMDSKEVDLFHYTTSNKADKQTRQETNNSQQFLSKNQHPNSNSIENINKANPSEQDKSINAIIQEKQQKNIAAKTSCSNKFWSFITCRAKNITHQMISMKNSLINKNQSKVIEDKNSKQDQACRAKWQKEKDEKNAIWRDYFASLKKYKNDKSRSYVSDNLLDSCYARNRIENIQNAEGYSYLSMLKAKDNIDSKSEGIKAYVTENNLQKFEPNVFFERTGDVRQSKRRIKSESVLVQKEWKVDSESPRNSELECDLNQNVEVKKVGANGNDDSILQDLNDGNSGDKGYGKD